MWFFPIKSVSVYFWFHCWILQVWYRYRWIICSFNFPPEWAKAGFQVYWRKNRGGKKKKEKCSSSASISFLLLRCASICASIHPNSHFLVAGAHTHIFCLLPKNSSCSDTQCNCTMGGKVEKWWVWKIKSYFLEIYSFLWYESYLLFFAPWLAWYFLLCAIKVSSSRKL